MKLRNIRPFFWHKITCFPLFILIFEILALYFEFLFILRIFIEIIISYFPLEWNEKENNWIISDINPKYTHLLWRLATFWYSTLIFISFLDMLLNSTL